MNNIIKRLTYSVIILPCVISCNTVEPQVRQTPMMGWSSWNSYRVDINDEIIMAAADSLISKGLANLGYRHVNIDDGWFGGIDGIGRNTDGTVKVNNERFPRGMRIVSDHIHSLGLKAGIYSDAGANTCGSIYDNDSAGIGVGMWQYDEIDANTFFIDWNFDHIKIDFCGGSDTGKSDFERYTAIRKAFNATGREDITMNICRWEFPGTWAIGTGSSWRIATDIYPNWKDVVKQFHQNLYLSAYAGPGHFNDMDMLEIGNPKSRISREQEYTHFALWCFMKSPLMIGGKLTTLSPEELAIYSNKSLIDINQDILGQQPYPIWRTDNQFILVSDIEKKNGKKRAVCFFNDSDQPYDFEVDFKDVCLSGEVKVINANSDKKVGVFNDKFNATLSPYQAIVYTFEGEKRLPQVRYEAENGFLNNYKPDNSPKRAVATYKSGSEFSTGAYVKQLGGSENNWLQFKNIHVDKKGEYKLSVAYSNPDKKDMYIQVNDDKYNCVDLKSEGESIFIHTLNIKLNKGNNMIKINNDFDFAPEIDYIEIK